MTESARELPPETRIYAESPASAVDLTRQYMKEATKAPLLSAEQETELSKRIEAGLFASQILDWQTGLAADEPQLLPGQIDLAHKYAADSDKLWIITAEGQAAKQKMIESNLRLVISLAKGYTGKGVDFLDLIQFGNIGLIRAVEKFDYAKGFKFSTYGTWWIHQAIRRGMNEVSRTIRYPTDVADSILKYNKAAQVIHQSLGRDATDLELAQHMNISVEKVKFLQELRRDPVSLDTIIGDDGDTTLGERVMDDDGLMPEASALSNEVQDAVQYAVNQLTDRQALVIRHRYGLSVNDPLTLDEIGLKFGLSKERIRQIQKEAEKKLKLTFQKLGIISMNDY